MMSKASLLVYCCLGLAALLAEPALGIQCFHCNSNQDMHCTEMFDHERAAISPTDCNVFEGSYCIKTTGMYKGEVGTQRFCSSRDWGNVCEFVQRKGDYREYRSCIHSCSGDGCNSAVISRCSLPLTVFTFLTLAIASLLIFTIH